MSNELKIAKELKTSEEIFIALESGYNGNDTNPVPPLFHGTDESLIGLSREDRNLINSSCELIIEELMALFAKNQIDMNCMSAPYYWLLKESKDSFDNFWGAYSTAMKRNKAGLHSYGDFYVTMNPVRAIQFSKVAWILGETGWTTNRLVEGVKILGFDLPKEKRFIDAFRLFEKRRDMLPAPCVLMIINASVGKILEEGGTEPKLRPLESAKKNKKIDSSRNYRLDLDPNDNTCKVYLIKNYSELYDACMKLIGYTGGSGVAYEMIFRNTIALN